ncbi:exodeoxyribonuclease VII large subunit [Alicyclobacillus tolerans]|uniref:exodeoxyribonuclease VII large subunit n=1 Tax=Alicyclobacillus tolerans TaxID=90970 RepID=UPI001F0308DF|nr:exodeoxyribonuclease VII large subunit [Alicyclobacillus tolerans]MCF8563600.1 exodeoxyribonuclease VII large subunit [Alicyclobacillus tolerans]
MIEPQSSAAIYTVAQLTEVIKHRLESDARLNHCYVAGEISNFKHHTSGHMYFTLKDEKSRIRAIMFASRSRSLKFVPQDGMRVIVLGSVSVFDRDGQYQLYAEDMQPDGIGALYVAFTQLRDRLEAEGLFAPERKRQLPAYPRRIGVVTSPTGAVIRDIRSTLARRYPLASIVLAPALVQGVEAADTIVRALDQLLRLSKQGKPVDVIIVARGGGSLEELWPFNEEVVARAISSCPIPVVSAVGHETDFTIADFVADVRAATPTAAAELVAPHVQDLNAVLNRLSDAAKSALRYRLSEQKHRLESVVRTPAYADPLRMVYTHRQRLDVLDGQVRQRAMKPVSLANRKLTVVVERLYRMDVRDRVRRAQAKLDQTQSSLREGMARRSYQYNAELEKIVLSLEALNPLTVLRRGYSVVYKEDGESVVTSERQLVPNERIQIRLSDGTVKARIEGGEGNLGGGEQSRLDI